MFALRLVDGHGRLSLAAPSSIAASVDDAAARGSGAWAVIQALELEVPGVAPPAGGNGAGAPATPAPPATIERLQRRRSILRQATLATDADRLEAALAACPLAEYGITEARVWLADDRLWFGGRAAIDGHEAAFTLRLASAPDAAVAAPAATRRLRLTLGDVRVYGFLPLPSPLVGAVVAAAIAAGAGARAPGLLVAGYAIDLDPLELALVPAMVAAGWRLPDLGAGRIAGPRRDGTTLHLGFEGGGDPTARPEAKDDDRVPLAHVEGVPLPEALRAAEAHLLAGDLQTAEAEYRAVAARAPDDRAAPARLLALRAASAGDDVGALAADITARWPDFIPAWLGAAVAAWLAGDASGSAALFERAAALAEARGETEDAQLARTEADAARSAAIVRFGGETMAAAAMVIERARTHLFDPGGGTAAAMAMRELRPAETPEEGLLLRAELAERLGDRADARVALQELETRARWAGDGQRAQEIARRLARTAGEEAASDAPGGADAGEPDEAAPEASAPAADAEAAAHAGSEVFPSASASASASAVDEIRQRATALYAQDGGRPALAALAADVEDLDPAARPVAFAALADVAEAHGDLPLAEQTYWRAAHAATDEGTRADLLVCHARVLLGQGDGAAALAELEHLLADHPGHAGALAALAAEAFRVRDWPRARGLYAELARAPDAEGAMPPALLLLRRAVLAHAAGDLAEAEAAYHQLAALEPQSAEPRRLLAEIALARGELPAAAQRMEEVLQLLPMDATLAVLDARERLAEIYLGLEDWGAARYYLELVLVQEPARIPALEQLVGVRERLGLYVEAADLCGRLARLYGERHRRAEALFHRGEILRLRLGDGEGAFDAYVKSSDLDPSFPPTALRLVAAYWERGELGDAADIAEDLRRAGPLPLPPAELPLRIRLGMAVALARRDAARGLAVAELAAAPWDANAAAEALAEAAALLVSRPPADLQPAAALLGSWARDGAPALAAALEARLGSDPGAAGAARALGWLADRGGKTARARALYMLALFADERDGAAARLDVLGAPPPPAPEDLALGGPNDHPDAAGRAAPLRRSLAALARALAGFGPLAARALPLDDRGLDSTPAAALHALGDLLGVPEWRLATTSKPTPQGDMLAIPTRPPVLEVPETLAAAPEAELEFLTARALDRLRGGLALVDAVTGGMAEDVAALLGAARAAVAGAPAPRDRAARVVRPVMEALAAPERRQELLGGAPAHEVIAELARAEELLSPGWERFREGAEHAGDRFAALACGSGLAALRALERLDAATPKEDDGGGDGAPAAPAPSTERERRQAFLRTPRARELVEFLLGKAPGRGAPGGGEPRADAPGEWSGDEPPEDLTAEATEDSIENQNDDGDDGDGR